MSHYRKHPNQTGHEYLAQVVTFSEACEFWCLHRSTLRYAIDAALVCARKSGRVWLISTPSLTAQYGNPQKEFRPLQA